jgi:hypothetical protein
VGLESTDQMLGALRPFMIYSASVILVVIAMLAISYVLGQRK